MNGSKYQLLNYDYKYIRMIKTNDKPKTSVYDIYSKHNDILGEIKWFPQWRQYCFFPEDDCVFSKGCMIDINNFIEQLMDLRKINYDSTSICPECQTVRERVSMESSPETKWYCPTCKAGSA